MDIEKLFAVISKYRVGISNSHIFPIFALSKPAIDVMPQKT